MTRQEIEEAVYNGGGSGAVISRLEDIGIWTDELWTYDMLKQCAAEKLEDDDLVVALHIIEALREGYGDDDVFAWDYNMGALEKICILSSPDDVIEWAVDKLGGME